VQSENYGTKTSARCQQRKNVHYRQIVNCVASLALSSRGEPLLTKDLCKVAGACERTIRNAFHELFETTPHRFIHMLRMGEARKALLSREFLSFSVTQIATHFGFFELGRFAVQYRLIFGECPSVTRRRTAASIRSGSAIYEHQGRSPPVVNGKRYFLHRDLVEHSGCDMPAHLAALETMPAVLIGDQTRALPRTCAG